MFIKLSNNPKTLSIAIGTIAMIVFMAILTHFYPPQYCHPVDRAMGSGHIPFFAMNQEHQLFSLFTVCGMVR